MKTYKPRRKSRKSIKRHVSKRMKRRSKITRKNKKRGGVGVSGNNMQNIKDLKLNFIINNVNPEYISELKKKIIIFFELIEKKDKQVQLFEIVTKILKKILDTYDTKKTDKNKGLGVVGGDRDSLTEILTPLIQFIINENPTAIPTISPTQRPHLRTTNVPTFQNNNSDYKEGSLIFGCIIAIICGCLLCFFVIQIIGDAINYTIETIMCTVDSTCYIIDSSCSLLCTIIRFIRFIRFSSETETALNVSENNNNFISYLISFMSRVFFNNEGRVQPQVNETDNDTVNNTVNDTDNELVISFKISERLQIQLQQDNEIIVNEQRRNQNNNQETNSIPNTLQPSIFRFNNQNNSEQRQDNQETNSIPNTLQPSVFRFSNQNNNEQQDNQETNSIPNTLQPAPQTVFLKLKLNTTNN